MLLVIGLIDGWGNGRGGGSVVSFVCECLVLGCVMLLQRFFLYFRVCVFVCANIM